MSDAAPDLRVFSLDVTVASPAGPSAVAEIARVWKERCPVYLALLNSNDITVSFQG